MTEERCRLNERSAERRSGPVRCCAHRLIHEDHGGRAGAVPALPQRVGAISNAGQREYFRLLARDTLALVVTLGPYRFWVATRCGADSAPGLTSTVNVTHGHNWSNLLELLVWLPGLLPVALRAARPRICNPQHRQWRVRTCPYRYLRADHSAGAAGGARPLSGEPALPGADHPVFRGLRFRQDGSAWVLRFCHWRSANCSRRAQRSGWPIPGRAQLERYKMRHTYYGDLQARFEGSGWELFKRGFLLWLIVWVPPLVALLFDFDDELGAFLLVWPLPAGLALYRSSARWRYAGASRESALAHCSFRPNSRSGASPRLT